MARCLKFLFVFFLLFAVKGQDSDPTELFNLGQDAQEKGDFKKAIQLYEKALELFPDFPEAEYQRASSLFQLGDINRAEEGFRRAIQLRPDWSLPITSLSFILVRKGNLDEAEKLLNQAIKIDPENQKAYILLAEIKLKTDRSKQELEEVYQKIKLFTEKANPLASIWLVRAMIERKLGELALAKRSLNQALKVDSQNISALSEKVEIALAEDDLETAVSDATKLLSLSDSTEAKVLFARVLLADGRTIEAEKIVQSLDQSNPEVIKIKQLIDTQSADFKSLEEKLVSEPENVLLLKRLCSLTRREFPLKAVEYCKRYFEKDPEKAALAYGAALVQAKQYETAIDILRNLIMKSPENYAARANLAVALFQTKRYKEAKNEFIWLSDREPNSPITYYFLAIANDQLGEYTQAILNYSEFLRLADSEKHKLEIEKVRLRLSVLQKLVEKKK